MFESLRQLFLENNFIPHGHCYLWQPGVLWLHILSDALITLAYFSIPFTLVYLVRKRKDIEFNWMFRCFAVFIVACGTTHLMEIVVIWHPVYWFSGIVKAVTALASVPTAILLVRLVPAALQLPSPTALRKANEELAREIAERKQAQAEVESVHRQLMDASREAGMAEIATNVLHNVGNVLNSVNVSAILVANSVQNSRASGLDKAVTLLKEHEHDLASFITNDPRGKNLPAYLVQLAEHLSSERQAILKEVESLRNNIEHIKEIVTMQQRYAQAGGVREFVNVIELVEDSLRMNADAMVRHHVAVVRDFASVPALNVDKHKVLQILVNLLRNAKQACEESGRAVKQLTLRVASTADRVEISVVDNGVGIEPENLTRIFNHGFTTRKAGHGFGLHSGALAARELGGSLSVKSAGAGCGATFTLHLPLNPAEPGYA